MKYRAFFLFFLLIIIAVGVVAADPQNLPGSGWKSGQQIQNIGDLAATVIMTAYDQAGSEYDCGAQALDPGESYTYLPEFDCTTMPSGFQGSAVVSGDQPLAAVVNVNNKGVGAAAGQYVGTASGTVDSTIVFPLIKNNHSGRTTTFYIQNTTSGVINISAEFVVNGIAYPKAYNNIPAYAMVIINPTDAGVPSGTGNLGSLTVSTSAPGLLAGVSLEHETAPPVANNMQASRAFTSSDFDDTVYCPLLRYDSGGKKTTTGLQVQNVSGGSEEINVTYTVVTGPSGAGTVIGPVSQTVDDGESANFLQSNDLLAGDVASAIVTTTGGGNIAAVVNDKATNSNPQRVTTYACFPEKNATDTISIPLYKENNGGAIVNTTGIQVQNVGTGPTTVTFQYLATNGTSVEFTHTDTLQIGQSKTFYQVCCNGTTNLQLISGNLANLSGTIGGVTITSNNGQQIVAIANESSLGSTNVQDTKNYEGFNK